MVTKKLSFQFFIIQFFLSLGIISCSNNTTSSVVDTSILSQIEENIIPVKGGTFTMGCNPQLDEDCTFAEQPAHQVIVEDYCISKYEVTQAQWAAIMGDNPSRFSHCKQCPVENVSWNAVQLFLQKLNQQTGKTYRLPTEAEWEYAARGGQKSQQFLYAGSDSANLVAWYATNATSTTHPVGQKQANELGLYDMGGNVSEWCQDYYLDYTDTTTTAAAPTPKEESYLRVNRGGSYMKDTLALRTTCRDYFFAENSFHYLGFRLALSDCSGK